MVAIADESGGACYGNHINRDFKERRSKTSINSYKNGHLHIVKDILSKHNVLEL